MMMLSLLLILSGFAGLMMELYKKTIRKDKANEGEVRLVAIIISTVLGYLLYMVLDPCALPDGIVFSPWITVLFAIMVYILQLPACMKIWKPIVKDVIERKAKDA